MSFVSKSLLLVAAFGLAACNNPDRYGAGGAGGAGLNGANGGANGGFGSGTGYVDTNGLGDPSNPASIAYFNQSVGDRVLFLVDQSSLTDQARGVLSQQARWLQSNPSYAIIIEGHADEQGTREYNLALGARRAEAVRTYLIQRGVPAGRIDTISFGKERPIAEGSSEAAWAQNRNAHTAIVSGAPR